MAAGVLMVLAYAPARAQWLASVGADSDYRFRGVSLSNGKPVVRAGASYDDDSGLFAGASLTRVQFDPGQWRASTLAYAGYAQRTASGASWEAGGTFLHFPGDTSYDYGEVFAGLAGDDWSSRIYLSPRYFGQSSRTAYVEFDTSRPLVKTLRAFAHLGALARFAGSEVDDHRTRLDARLGLAWSAGALDMRIAWVGASTGGPYPSTSETRRNTVVAGATFTF